MSLENKRVILGLSGGVDSAVAIKLLQDEGYIVEGMFMRNWDSLLNNDVNGNPNDPFDVCPQEKDYMDAVSVSKSYGIKLHRVDFVKEYWDNVFTYFLDEYKKNRTPNPDCLCNKYIKFDSFYKEALKLGCDFIAMGHYAKRVDEEDGFHLYKAKDLSKDQTYFLCLTEKNKLEHSLFPLGDILKTDVRKIANDLDLSIKDKKDSTGICFIGERNFSKFLSNYLPAKPGIIVDTFGNILGEHYGLMNYTIGQRKGMGIGGISKDKDNLPWFVCGKDLLKNELIVSQDEEDLLSDYCTLENINLINPLKTNDLYGKFRYRAPDEKIHIEINGNKAIVTYDNVKSVTPGQILAFYNEDGECLGGGIINEVYYKNKKRNY